ncbi:MAG: phosphatidate cytidylyltransferase [Prevotellaceae bacterium]|jgi:phosphatidate cytidylyltransferase|nr:phosphatidate cytidylyltransferase [Prevotellaceae bacterium]
MKLNNLLTRILSGTAYVMLMLGSLYLCPQAFAGVMVFAMVVAMHEFYGIAAKTGVKPQRIAGLLCGVAVFAACYAGSFGLLDEAYNRIFFYLPVPLAVFVFYAELFRKKNMPFTNIAYTLLGVIYVALPFSLTSFVYEATGVNAMCSFFILLWANDTFAYFFGLAFGRHKLFPAVSPKKSWEGYIGGIVSVLAAAWGLHQLFGDVALIHLVSFGVIISLTAVLADLVESMLKRSAGVKDSGTIMPGHGGLLDRFDAALLSLPLVFVYVQLFMNN